MSPFRFFYLYSLWDKGSAQDQSDRQLYPVMRSPRRCRPSKSGYRVDIAHGRGGLPSKLVKGRKIEQVSDAGVNDTDEQQQKIKAGACKGPSRSPR